MIKKCSWCGNLHNRRVFCSNKCKDKFHNYHNPRGKFAHLKGKSLIDQFGDVGDDIHPFSEEGLGQE